MRFQTIKIVNAFVLCSFFLLAMSCGGGAKDEAEFGPPGKISGSVKDAISGEGIAGVDVFVSYPGRGEVARGESDEDGLYQIEVPSAEGFSVEFDGEGYKRVSYSNVQVEARLTNFLEAVLQIDENVSGTGAVGGIISDAFSGAGIQGVTLNLRLGVNAREGSILASVITGSFGSYKFLAVETGNYTIEASHDDYNAGYFSVISIGGEERLSQSNSLSKGLAIGETRIVLTWGETPRDLDSHLYGPNEDEANRFHIYFSNKGTNLVSPFVRLDTDDLSSFGPETITISQQFEGTYSYYVNNYSETPSMSDRSNARVEVYKEAGRVATFNVPAGKSGDWWHVFDLDGENLLPINEISFSIDELRSEEPHEKLEFKLK